VLLSTALSRETPQRQDRAVKRARRSIVYLLGIVSVIVELLLISILDNHSFHYFEGTFHRCRVERILNGGYNLLNRLFIFPVFHCLLEFGTLVLFICSHICIEDLPLSGLEGEVSLDRRVSFDTALLQGQVESLA